MSRIFSLPRRDAWAEPGAIIDLMTAWLRTSTGTMRLYPVQALTLFELAACKGVFCAARVGAGKTLASGLAPVVLGAKRPMIVVPAKGDLVAKTHDEYAELRRHWRIPWALRVESYNRLGIRPRCRVHGGTDCPCPKPDLLEEYKPDFLGFDEAHKLKRVRSAACARRVARYMAAHPECNVAVFTATPTRHSIKDYAHLMNWALRNGSPMPIDPDMIEEWAFLLDDEHRSNNTWHRADYSILTPHLGPTVTDRESARVAFADRMLSTPGVIVSQDSFDDVPLTIEPLHVETPPGLQADWQKLRELWVQPDDWPLSDKSFGVYGTALQLALGFYYQHQPRPPDDWIDARREWCSFCRRVLETSDELDSDAQVQDACRLGRLPAHAWERWIAIKDEHEPNPVPVWLSAHAIQAAAQWGQGGGIIWTDFAAFGEGLARVTGWPYYGQAAKTAAGDPIRRATAPTIIASTASCTDGQNLQIDVGPGGQGYCRMLMTSPPKADLDWEQQIGRIHRNRQTRPCTVHYMVGCLENWVALPVALSYAAYTEETLRQPQKILHCDRTDPRIEWLRGWAYGKE